jgi:hypothetical protein
MHPHVARLGAAGLAAALLAPPVLAQPTATGAQQPPNELSQLRDELTEQRALVNRLLHEVQSQREQLQRMQATPRLTTPPGSTGEAQRDVASNDPTPLDGAPFALPTATADGVLLSQQRGAGGAPGGQAPVAEPPVLPPAVTGVPSPLPPQPRPSRACPGASPAIRFGTGSEQ